MWLQVGNCVFNQLQKGKKPELLGLVQWTGTVTHNRADSTLKILESWISLSLQTWYSELATQIVLYIQLLGKRSYSKSPVGKGIYCVIYHHLDI